MLMAATGTEFKLSLENTVDSNTLICVKIC